MKESKSRLLTRWVLPILGLVVVTLIIGVGGAYIQFGESGYQLSYWDRGVIIGLVMLVYLLILASRWFIAYLKRESQVNAMTEKAHSNDQHHQEQLLRLSAERTVKHLFEAALKPYRSGHSVARIIGTEKHHALYSRPWFLLIGSNQSGKTTLLNQSELSFFQNEATFHNNVNFQNSATNTKSSHWVPTAEALFIETTAGFNHTDKPLERYEWLALLKQLKQGRHQCPVNGVILTISVEDLLANKNLNQQTVIEQTRDQIQTIQAQLDPLTPIYLILTKCDKINGFTQFFSHLPHAESSQAWGITWPEAHSSSTTASTANHQHSISADNKLEHFRQQFQNLLQQLQSKVAHQVSQLQNRQQMAAAQAFPTAMGKLNTPLEQLLATLLSDGRHAQSPNVKGLFFTSATQALFTRQLMSGALLPESTLSHNDQRTNAKSQWQRRAVLTGLAASVAAITSIWYHTVETHQQQVNHQQSIITDFKTEKAAITTALKNMVRTEATPHQVINIINRLEQQQAELKAGEASLHLGLDRQSTEKQAAFLALYQQSLHTLLLPSLLLEMEHFFNTASPSQSELYNALRVYLMMIDPTHREVASIVEWWSQHGSDAGLSADESHQLIRPIQQLFSNDAVNPSLLATRPAELANSTLITQLRGKLQRISLDEQIYAELRDQNNRLRPVNIMPTLSQSNSEGLRLSNSTNNGKATAFTIPFFYTREGYESVDWSINAEFFKHLNDSQWVLGNSNKVKNRQEQLRLLDNVKALYLQEYAAHWNRPLQAINVRPFRSIKSTTESLDRLSDPIQSPIVKLLNTLKNNTNLTQRPLNQLHNGSGSETVNESINKSVNAIAKTSADAANRTLSALQHQQTQQAEHTLAQRFSEFNQLVASQGTEPTKIHSTLTLLGELSRYLKQQAVSGDIAKSNYAAAKLRFTTAGSSDPISALRLHADTLPSPIKQWVLDITDQSWRLMLAGAKQHINALWQEEVYTLYQRKLSHRYPLNPNAQQEVSITAFSDFFKPSGLLSEFVTAHLEPFVDTRNWKVKLVEGQGLGINRKTLQQFKSADRLAEAYFKENREQPSFRLNLKPLKLDTSTKRFELTVGEQAFNYTHGPRITETITWPDNSEQVHIQFQDFSNLTRHQLFDGEWALLKALQTFNLQQSRQSNIHQVTFAVNRHQASYELKSPHSINPLNLLLTTPIHFTKIL